MPDVQQLRHIALMGEQTAIWLADQLVAGGPYTAWYPSLHLAQPQLLITLHTDSLTAISAEDMTARDWLIATARHSRFGVGAPDADVVVTPARKSDMPEWATGLPLLGAGVRSRFIEGLYAQSLVPDWDQVRSLQQPAASLLDIKLHEQLGRHVFVTRDNEALDYGLLPERGKKAFVVDPRHAQRYVDLALTAFGAYRVNPNYSVNRGLYYWMRLWSSIPSFQEAWPQAVFGAEAAPKGIEIREFMHALYARIMGMMQAHDRLGWLRYSPANNDTRDEMLNQLNYFIVLSTGAFDSLAWLALHRFQITERSTNVTLRATRRDGGVNPFFSKLETAAPALATYLRDARIQDRITLFYEPRDSIQHRLVLTGAHLSTGQHVSDCNVAFLDEAMTAAIEVVDHHDPEDMPFRVWGMLVFADDGSRILEPYRFTGAALQFLFALVDGVLQRLDLATWLNSFPDLQAQADVATNEGRQQHCLPFATPFPWTPNVSVL